MKPFTLKEIIGAYQLPTNLPPGGTIAIIEIAGAYYPNDMAKFCASEGIPCADVVEVNRERSESGEGDLEVALDTQMAVGAYAHMTGGSQVHIRVYHCKFIQQAVHAILQDLAAGHDIRAASYSWGASEHDWGLGECREVDKYLARLQAAGVTLCVAAGDSGVINFPASSPHVICCGGTSRTDEGEVVWNVDPTNRTSGGYSEAFPLPDFQAFVPLGATGRMIPDVAAHADNRFGYRIVCRGQPRITAGTSAVAPLYAGIIAAYNPPRSMNVLQAFWQNPGAFTKIMAGNNGQFSALSGPDPCTGLGVPYGVVLSTLFKRSEPTEPEKQPEPEEAENKPAPGLLYQITMTDPSGRRFTGNVRLIEDKE